MKRLLLTFACAIGLQGAITGVSVTTTATQAILRYTAPSGSACTVDVAGVNDLDTSLFTGANLDSRAGNPSVGQSRVFVIGKRTAEVATNGKRYTRALQVSTSYSALISCGADTAVKAFSTANLPLGDTYNEGPPIDRAVPGQYAYPTVNWTTPAFSLIDPHTGVKSYRATSPIGTASEAQEFQTAIDGDSAWANDAGPLTSGGGAGTITGSVSKLLLRADDLALTGGATYTVAGVSLDWITATFAASSINGACSGNDCKVSVCLTVDGVTCASGTQDIALTTTPASYTLGSGGLMDLWQTTGGPGIARPDVSKASGTVNYVASSHVVTWASGHKFSTRWGAGSRITVGGTEYPIASVQSELTLTLASGPVGNLTGSAYSANNFGVLVWKKTTAADQVSIGHATFLYGSTAMPTWPALSVDNCGPTQVVVGGVSGYNCFIDRELYWVSSNGSSLVDLGYVGFSYWGDDRWGTSAACGSSSEFQSFDPLSGDRWYCMILAASTDEPATRRWSIIRATYHGAHTARTNGLLLPDCGLNGDTYPCVEFTRMQPLAADSVEIAGPAFNSEFASSGYTVDTSGATYDSLAYFRWGGVSPEGTVMVYSSELLGQDSKGWQFMFTLGDRTPAGTNGNSLAPIAAASSYLHAPLRWCVIHTSALARDNWQPFGCNSIWIRGAGANYAMALTSTPLNTTVDAAGGLNTCPSNPYGITGKNCTAIEVGGEPARVADAYYLQDSGVGDVISVAERSGGSPIYATSEYVRVLTKADSQHMVVQRGYLETVKNHAGVTDLVMACGIRSAQEQHMAIWDYVNDPYGLNASGTAIVIDTGVGGHEGSGNGVRAAAAGAGYNMGDAHCPVATVGSGGACYAVRRGTLPQTMTATTFGVASNPAFAGVLGVGNPNQVDSHPGPCQSSWCLDARPMDGGTTGMVGSSGTPFTNTSGQLWKLAGGATALSSKVLPTVAYVGRSPLVDISGPASAIPSDSTGSYQYCVALADDECVTGSTAGDVYVNAPYVSAGYCVYNGVAIQGDDTNSICVGSLGPYVGNVVQAGMTVENFTGATSRRLGTFFSRWNQHYVYWNALATPNGSLIFNQARWLDGVRSEDLVSILPSYPATDAINRGTFVPVNVVFEATGGVDNVLVEFGYGENGAATDLFCTTRQETCAAVGSTVSEATPFYWESETFSGLACVSGCTVAIPTLPGRVTYYRAISRNGDSVVVTGDIQAISTEVEVTVPSGISGSLNISGSISIQP